MSVPPDDAGAVVGLPGSPNWFCGQVVDYSGETGEEFPPPPFCVHHVCMLTPNPPILGAVRFRLTGLLALGASCRVLLLRMDGRGRQSVKGYLSASNRPSDRVNSVAFSRNPGFGNLCVSAGTDGVVYLWDAESETCLSRYTAHSGTPIAAVSFPAFGALTDTVYAADTKGKVSQWLHGSGSTTSCSPVHEEAYCLSVSSCHIVAVGYKGGTVAAISFATSPPQLLHCFAGHTLEVQCVSWIASAVADAVFGHGQGALICSSARDKTFRVWSLATGDVHLVWSLPAPRKRVSGSYGRDNREKIWLTHVWAGSGGRELVSTAHNGDLVRWSFDGQLPPTMRPSPHSGRPQAVFTLCPMPAIENGVVTVSSDRQVRQPPPPPTTYNSPSHSFEPTVALSAFLTPLCHLPHRKRETY